MEVKIHMGYRLSTRQGFIMCSDKCEENEIKLKSELNTFYSAINISTTNMPFNINSGSKISISNLHNES